MPDFVDRPASKLNSGRVITTRWTPEMKVALCTAVKRMVQSEAPTEPSVTPTAPAPSPLAPVWPPFPLTVNTGPMEPHLWTEEERAELMRAFRELADLEATLKAEEAAAAAAAPSLETRPVFRRARAYADAACDWTRPASPGTAVSPSAPSTEEAGTPDLPLGAWSGRASPAPWSASEKAALGQAVDVMIHLQALDPSLRPASP